MSNTDLFVIVADGVYKFTYDDVCLISMGFVVRDSVFGKSGHSASYVECVLGLCKSEGHTSFGSVLQSMYTCMRHHNVEMENKIAQLCGDFSEGLEKCRQDKLPSTTRLTSGKGVFTVSPTTYLSQWCLQPGPTLACTGFSKICKYITLWLFGIPPKLMLF